MSRRSNASNARNAPFGTDIQPTVKTRIIGGKTVEIAVKSPPASVGSRVSSGSLHTGPHGTPPMQYQPPVNESNHGNYNNNPNPLPGNYRNIYSQTAPRDSSNSHIHGKGNHYDGRPGAQRALPPIHASDHSHDHGDDDDVWSEDMAQEDLPNIKDILQKPFPVHIGSSSALSPINNKRSLTDQVSEHLIGYDPLHFKEMYTELAEFDHGLLGFVSQPQMNMIAHKHKVPIPISTLRLLFSNFAKGSNPDQVNYEKLIQFLARAQLGSAKAQTLLEDDVKKFVHETNGDGKTDHELERLNAQIKRFEEKEEKERKEEERKLNEKRDNKNRKEQEKWKPSFVTRKPLKTFSELEDAMLIRMLEEQFTDGKKKQTINTEGMREMCLKKDRQEQGTFSRRDLDDLFLYYRIPVQGSLLNKMIQRIDTGDGQLSWVAFLEILERVDSGDAMTPRGEKNQNHSQRRASEDPNLASIGNRNSFGNSPRNSGSQRERSGNRSRDGPRPHAGGLAPVIEPRRPSTWPKRPFKEVLPTPEEPKKVTSPPWLRKPLARIDPLTQAQEPDNDVTSVEMEITRNDTPTEDHASLHSPPSTPSPKQEGYEIDRLRQMAEEHQRRRRGHRPVDQQEVVMKSQQKKNEKREREEWFKGFVHLAKGLYSTDTSKTGCLEREEMLRLVNNYNLIYQLGISSSHIKRVVETCCHEGDQVPIKPVIEILRQKRK
ncbi:uncharacterized protein C1orf87-like [Strongylocentrotus purpuratus]|uniref:EF-hand domain-containing protein n=1 Tax=Strongylocentrotus purpuratus TaxID=7668 RepID=A0A7M7PJP0_STRPU|nr:uncharacterized protein C1orf87-like [Strongylocentrotus purpuratus]